MRRLRHLSLSLAILASAFALPAWAGHTTVNPIPGQPLVNQPITVVLSKTGRHCGVKVDFGNGTIAGPLNMTTGQRSFPGIVYSSPGQKTIRVWGKKKPGDKPACKGSDQILFSVAASSPPPSDGGGRAGTPTLQVAPKAGALRTRKPKGVHGNSKPSLGVGKPGLTDATKIPKGIQEEKVTLPGTNDMTKHAPKILTAGHYAPPGGGIPEHPQHFMPGSKVILNGKNFGTSGPGKMYITGLPGHAKLVLTPDAWADSAATAYIPTDIDVPHRVHDIKVFVERKVAPAWAKTSAGFSKEFEVKSEILMLKWDDPSIHAECKGDSNQSRCNRLNAPPSSCTHGDSVYSGTNLAPDYDYSLFGYHMNCWAAVGDDTGRDEFTIRLKRGWTIDKISATEYHKTSGDESWNSTDWNANAAIGKSEWKPRMGWRVSPDDSSLYRVKVWIRGKPGTRWF